MWKHLFKFYFVYLCTEQSRIRILFSRVLNKYTDKQLDEGLCVCVRRELVKILCVSYLAQLTGEANRITVDLLTRIDLYIFPQYRTQDAVFMFANAAERRLLLKKLLESDDLFMHKGEWKGALEYMYSQNTVREALQRGVFIKADKNLFQENP